MRKIWIAGIVLIAVALIVFTSLNATEYAANEAPIKIGGAFALSGFASQWGEAELNAAGMAIEETNAKGGIDGRKIEMITENIESDSIKSVIAVSKLIHADKIDVIIGPSWLDSFGGAAPLADENEVLMITPSASITAVKKEKNYGYVFSTWYRADVEIKELARHLSGKRIVLFFGNDPFWEDISQNIKKNSDEFELKILGEYKFNSKETDFRTALIKIKETNPDAIVFGLNDERGILSFLQQRQVLYPDSVLYTTESIEEFLSKDDFKALMENMRILSPKIVENDFSDRYKERFGTEPVFSASNAYDATMILIEAMKAGNMDAESIRDYIANNEFSTVTFGNVRFDEIGGISGGEFVIKRVKNGTVEVIA